MVPEGAVSTGRWAVAQFKGRHKRAGVISKSNKVLRQWFATQQHTAGRRARAATLTATASMSRCAMCRDKLTYQQCSRAAVAYCEVAQDGHAVTLHSHFSSSAVTVSRIVATRAAVSGSGRQGVQYPINQRCASTHSICFNLEHPVSVMSSYVAPACGAYGSCQQLSMASLTSSTYVSCSAPALGALQSKLTRTPPAGSSSATARC